MNGAMSDTISMSTRVPQGSNLGPLLLLIFINDFIRASNFFFMRLFADDISLTTSDKLLLQINSELININDWLRANRLTLNLKKTKYLIFQQVKK